MASHLWRKPLPFNVHCFPVSDSRFRDIKHWPAPNQHIYYTDNVVKSGARICNLEQPILSKLASVPSSDIAVTYICAGIIELTFKEYNPGGVEIVLHSNQCVLDNILSLKYKIRRYFPNCIVGLATIPIISFKETQEYNKTYHNLVPSYSDYQLDQMQNSLSNLLAEINPVLTHENRYGQMIPGFGDINPAQLYLHQNIERSVSRKNSSGTRITKRIPEGVLIDGIHPTYKVNLTWFNAIHANFGKAITEMRHIYFGENVYF